MTRQQAITAAPDRGGCATWWAWCIWLPGCVGFGVLLAWASLEVGDYFSPLVIFPLVVGFLLGAALVALMRIFQMGHRPAAWLAVGLSAAAVVLGQHYFSYREALARADHVSSEFLRAQHVFGAAVQGSLPPRPAGLVDYLRRQAAQGRPLTTVFGTYQAKGYLAWLCWAVDGLLVLLAAAVMVGLALRRPFCRRCRSWYSTRGAGRLDEATVRRLAEELSLPLDGSAEKGRYRLICCDRGCGPSGFSLSCGEPPRPVGPEIVWLDDREQNHVMEILKETIKHGQENMDTPRC